MRNKIAVVGAVVAVTGLGVGGAAWADSTSPAAQSVAGSAIAGPAVAGSATNTLSTSALPSTRTGINAPAGSKVGMHPKGRPDRLSRRLMNVSHAQWVTKNGRTGAFVTHDAANGQVVAVGATSITIKATDGTPETFAVTPATKVHVKGVSKAATTISRIKVGDRAAVLGTGATAKTATWVVDRGPRT